jgi:hypothetical protein
MAGFYSILSRSIDALDPATPQARRRLYERATAALIAEMRGPDPALDQPEFQAAWRSLKEAIVRIETETAAAERTQAEMKAESGAESASASQPEAQAQPPAAPEAQIEPDMEAGPAAEAETESPRHRQPTAAASSAPAHVGMAAPSRPAPQLAGLRRPRLKGLLTRAFRRDPDAAPRSELPAAPGEEPSDVWSELASSQAHDNWMSDLLARASRDDPATRKKRT